MSAIDAKKRAVVSSLLANRRPGAAAFAPDGKRVYASNEISGPLAGIDAES